MNTFYKLLAMKADRDVMLKYLFELACNIFEDCWEERSNAVLTKEVVCALSWHLPLHPWSEIDIRHDSVHIVFTPSSSIVVKCDFQHRYHARVLQVICCSHVQRILGDESDFDIYTTDIDIDLIHCTLSV